jgi:hypothetical protein
MAIFYAPKKNESNILFNYILSHPSSLAKNERIEKEVIKRPFIISYFLSPFFGKLFFPFF